MPEIRTGDAICTVIVTVDADPAILPTLREHAEMGLQRFDQFPGYIGGALHVSAEKDRLVQYLQWSSEAEYIACRDDPAWDVLPSTRAFLAAIASGRARVHASTYRVAAVSQAV